MKVGVIDIGTLKVKLLLADINKGGEIHTKYQSNTLTCLGVRMDENGGRPQEKYLEDTLSELERCKGILEKEGVKKIRAVSTHALREMGNTGKEIGQRIKNEVGLKVEIISQQEEARLFFNAVVSDFKTKKDFTFVDIGGGSVQILIGNKENLKEVHLFKTGAQFLFDKFSPRHTGDDYPTRAEIRKMQKYIMQNLTEIPGEINTPVIYGSSCIIDLFKTIGIKLDRSNLSDSHPFKTSVSELETFLEKVIPMPYDKREEMYKFSQKYYMWGIDKAFLNVINISKKVNAPYVVPSNANINTGLVMSLIS